MTQWNDLMASIIADPESGADRTCLSEPANFARDVEGGEMEVTRTKGGKPRKNDANYCRLKGWKVGSVLRVYFSDFYDPLQQYFNRCRITAIGEEAILVRRIHDNGECSEERSVRTLIDRYVEIEPSHRNTHNPEPETA